MEKLDVKTTLEDTLAHKQEMIREYQMNAKKMADPELSKMYSHFAEEEALQAMKIKDILNQS